MDVTLERVQFKFASIIGELCSKPMILSQFAIWVDLRLAEYKLKGSISLGRNRVLLCQIIYLCLIWGTVCSDLIFVLKT